MERHQPSLNLYSAPAAERTSFLPALYWQWRDNLNRQWEGKCKSWCLMIPSALPTRCGFSDRLLQRFGCLRSRPFEESGSGSLRGYRRPCPGWGLIESPVFGFPGGASTKIRCAERRQSGHPTSNITLVKCPPLEALSVRSPKVASKQCPSSSMSINEGG